MNKANALCFFLFVVFTAIMLFNGCQNDTIPVMPEQIVYVDRTPDVIYIDRTPDIIYVDRTPDVIYVDRTVDVIYIDRTVDVEKIIYVDRSADVVYIDRTGDVIYIDRTVDVEKIIYVDRTVDTTTTSIPSDNQGTKITSLQVAINKAEPNGVIDFTDSKYSSITTIESMLNINKAVTIKNFDNLGGASLNVISDGVVLSNVNNTNVYTNSSLKISGSSLSSLNICTPEMMGRGAIKERPPVVELLSSEVSSDVTIALNNAYLTVHDVTADKIKFNADNTQLTIEDSSSVINSIITDKTCQVVLEDGTSDTIPYSEENIHVSGNGKLTQVNMKAAESMILTKLTPERGLVTTMKEDESIDFSSLEVVGTYMSSGAVTVFTAALTYDMQTTFSKLEKDFKIVIGNTLAYQRVNGTAVQTNFDWSSLSAGYHPAVIESDFADKGSEYKYSFDVVVVERKIEHRLSNITPDVSNMKTEYLAGERLDLMGLVVEGTYLDTPTKPVGLLPSQYRAEPANDTVLTTDITKVHISDLSGDLSADIEITVKASCLFTIDYGYSQNGIPMKVVNLIEKGTVVYEPSAGRYGYEFVKWIDDDKGVDYVGFNKKMTDDKITVKVIWNKIPPFAGAIVYQDATTNDESNDRYIFMNDPIPSSVPIGIVFDFDGGIGKMVHLKQADDRLEWCKGAVDLTNDTGDDDGSVIWQNIGNVISNNLNNYPAFNYVADLSSDDPNNQWYLPAKNEFKFLMTGTIATVQGGLTKLQNYYDYNDLIYGSASDTYWSSSVIKIESNYPHVYNYNNHDGESNNIGTYDWYVRAIRKFRYVE